MEERGRGVNESDDLRVKSDSLGLVIVNAISFQVKCMLSPFLHFVEFCSVCEEDSASFGNGGRKSSSRGEKTIRFFFFFFSFFVFVFVFGIG